MSRFEVTIAGGEKVLVDHPGDGIQDLLSDLASKDFLLLNEVRLGSSGPVTELIVASRGVTLVRSLEGGSRQGTTFRPKR